jgi:hypothetical protein
MKKYYTLNDLANLVTWDQVDRAIKYFYPTDHNHYKHLFWRIRKWPKARVPKGEYLIIQGGLPDPNSEFFKKYGEKYLADMKAGDDGPYYGVNLKKVNDEMTWAVSFTPWKIFVNWPIWPDTLTHYNPEEIVAHVIWEMTFYGGEAEMMHHAKAIKKAVKEIKSGKAKTVPMDKDWIKKMKKKIMTPND